MNFGLMKIRGEKITFRPKLKLKMKSTPGRVAILCSKTTTPSLATSTHSATGAGPTTFSRLSSSGFRKASPGVNFFLQNKILWKDFFPRT
jgi:hypothetical protein